MSTCAADSPAAAWRHGAADGCSAPGLGSTASAVHRPYTRIGPIEIALHSDMPEIAEDFAALYRGWRYAAPADARTIHMEVKAAGRTLWGARRYAIRGDGVEIFARLRAAEVFPYLEWGINYRVIATRPEFLQLHAATLCYRDAGVMLVGPSGSGKSTLTAALAARGWGYLSDEFALIDPATHALHAYPKALCIKAGSFDLVRRLGLPLWNRRPYLKAFKGRVGYVSPHEVTVRTQPCPLRLIVFPRYAGGTQPTVRPVERGRTAFLLAANAFNRHVFGDGVVPLLADVVHDVRCVALEPGDLDATCTALEKLLATS